jgi:hypothetical protein
VRRRENRVDMPRFIACIVSLVLLASGRVHASDAPPRSIAVELCDLEHLPRVISHKARSQLLRTFQRIRVDVAIVPCGERHESDSFRVAIVILQPDSRGPADVPAIALGALSLSLKREPIVWIFYRRIERAAHRAAVDPGIVLGHVIAHEIAHALLPVAGHGPSGLMRATWRSTDLVAAWQGQLRFSGDEAAAIRDRLGPSPATASPIAATTAVD